MAKDPVYGIRVISNIRKQQKQNQKKQKIRAQNQQEPV